jgi:hypothetical protein
MDDQPSADDLIDEFLERDFHQWIGKGGSGAVARAGCRLLLHRAGPLVVPSSIAVVK